MTVKTSDGQAYFGLTPSTSRSAKSWEFLVLVDPVAYVSVYDTKLQSCETCA